MALSVNINLAQKQKLVVTQTLREAIELLQISSLELKDRIEQELEENPVLELKAAENDGTTPPSPEEAAAQADTAAVEERLDDDMMRMFDDAQEPDYQSRTTASRDPDSKQQFIEGALQRAETFHEHLLDQLGLAVTSEADRTVGEILISYINEEGYLPVSVEEIAAANPVPERGVDDFTRMRRLILAFDPPGSGALTLAECLLVQLEEQEPQDTVAMAIIRDHFTLLEKHKFKQLATRLGVSEARVDEAVQRITFLEPKPGRPWVSRAIEYVIPDVIVDRDEDGEFRIIINDDWIPGLSISRYYRKLLKQKKLNKAEKNYIIDKFSSAQWLIKSIAQRRSTLYTVMEAILDAQRQYFEQGPGHLRPLTLREIADKIGMHESTVSRVTSNKYVQTQWGIVSQKYFFSSSLRTADGQTESSRSVKELIKRIIDGEAESGRTMSDQDIVGVLENKGIRIARRTVAKYRKMLKILPSSQRHQ